MDDEGSQSIADASPNADVYADTDREQHQVVAPLLIAQADTNNASPASDELSGGSTTVRGQPLNTGPVLRATPTPRFPLSHPISEELYGLYKHAAVVHSSAVSKPWMLTLDSIEERRPDNHPLLSEQFKTWHDAAWTVCPGGELQPLQ